MDTEANFYEDEEDLDMLIERQGDVNEENDDGDNENRQPVGSDDEAEEAPARKKKDDKDGKDDETKKKRVLAPRPKLDPIRLMGTRGLLALQAEMKGVNLKGRGYELQDLDLVMGRLQHWAHRLFPSYTFDDCLDKLEKLGTKKNVMVHMKKIRMGLESAEDVHDTTIRGEDLVDEPPAPNDDPFGDLVASVRTTSPTPAPAPAAPIAITDEQRERMLRNRMIAEARKLERLQKQQEEEQRIREEEEAMEGIV